MWIKNRILVQLSQAILPKKLLNDVSNIVEIAEDVEACKPFIVAFQFIRNVVDACFGIELRSNYRTNIQTFHDAHMNTSIRITPSGVARGGSWVS